MTAHYSVHNSLQVVHILEHINPRHTLPSFSLYRGADESLARPTSRCNFFGGDNISFDASLVIYINSINIPAIMVINRI